MIFQRKFIKFIQIIFILAGIILLFGNEAWFPSYYRPRLMALVALLYSFLIELPALIIRDSDITTDQEKIFFRRQFQIVLALGLLASGLGSLGLWGLYQIGIPYDKFVHFSFSAVMTISGTFFIQVWQGWSFKKTIFLIILIVGASDLVWEFIELWSNRYLNFGFFGHLFDHDSIFDILSGLLGVIAGGVILVWRGWLDKKLSSFLIKR